MKQNPSLLIVDDEPDVIEAYKMVLEESGYEVYSAHTQAEALEVLETSPIALCLLDLKLKDEDGIRVSQELYHADPLLKIIIITAYPTYETAVDAIKTGVSDYTSKTEDPRLLLKKIEKALEARNNEIAAKSSHTLRDKKGLVLVCNHALIQGGIEHFCKQNPYFYLSHSYRSSSYIKANDFNASAALLLLCMSCCCAGDTDRDKAFAGFHSFFPNARIIAINSNVPDEEKMELIKHGVMGFLPENISQKNMKKAFHAVLKGEMWVGRGLTYQLLSQLLEKSVPGSFKKPANMHKLSKREVEILQAMGTGLSNHQISEKFFISENTVKIHVNHIFKKLNVKSRTQAVMKAQEVQII